jgi:pSer/pThr/pTyr-binding forkhead associated (FHA) protein
LASQTVLRLRLSHMGRPLRTYSFDQERVLIGRDRGADVHADQPGVAPDHLRLERLEDGRYRLVDLGSANGTYLNDHPVKQAVLGENDVVRFGQYTVWVGYEQDRRTRLRTGTDAEPIERTATARTHRAPILEMPATVALEVESGGAVDVPGPQDTAIPGFALGLVIGAGVGAFAAWLWMRL